MNHAIADGYSRRLADPIWSQAIAKVVKKRYRNRQIKRYTAAAATLGLVVVLALSYTAEREASLTASALMDPFNSYYESGFPDY